VTTISQVGCCLHAAETSSRTLHGEARTVAGTTVCTEDLPITPAKILNALRERPAVADEPAACVPP
jgi:hypothetical protein